MIFGSGGIIFQSLQTAGGGMPGPPFDPTSADNGLSVDPISGKIVLGNDVAALTAVLLNNREIPNGGFSLYVKDALSTFGMGFGSSNFVNGVPILVNAFSSNSDTNGIFLQNASNGASAAALMGVYNDVNTNFRVGVTGSNYISNISLLQFPPDSCFFETQSNTLDAKLYITGQAGIFFQSDLVADPVTPSMKLQNGDLTMITGDIFIKTSQFTDNGSFLLIDPTGGVLRLHDPAANVRLILLNTGSSDGFIIDSANRAITSASGAGQITIGLTPGENVLIPRDLRVNGNLNANGTPGFSGTVSPVVSITVSNGIVTAVS